MNKIMGLWRRLHNRINRIQQGGKACNLGNLVAKYNFLVKDSQQLHLNIHKVFAKMYPNIFVDGLAFNDLLGLLGYDMETDFTSVFDLFYKVTWEYKDFMKAFK